MFQHSWGQGGFISVQMVLILNSWTQFTGPEEPFAVFSIKALAKCDMPCYLTYASSVLRRYLERHHEIQNISSHISSEEIRQPMSRSSRSREQTQDIAERELGQGTAKRQAGLRAIAT